MASFFEILLPINEFLALDWLEPTQQRIKKSSKDPKAVNASTKRH